MYAVVVLFVLSLVTAVAFDPGAGIVVEYVLLAAAFGWLAVQLGRGRNWARVVVVGLSVLFLLTTFSLFQAGVPGVVKVAGGVQVVLFLGIIVLLLVRPSNAWFRPLP